MSEHKRHWPKMLRLRWSAVAATSPLATLCGRQVWMRDCVTAVDGAPLAEKDCTCKSCQRILDARRMTLIMLPGRVAAAWQEGFDLTQAEARNGCDDDDR